MDWAIRRYGKDVFILGPGALEILLRDFDPKKLRVECQSEAEQDQGLLEDLYSRSWQYLMGGRVALELTSLHDKNKPEEKVIYRLEIVGTAVYAKWDVPEEFAEKLYALG